jgi:chromosome segregation protein
MRLTSLELLGFKSFYNRTTFRFDQGVTCIVGPNGCGKSNIVDAITWVLGERGTKSLRVKEMGDVIFHGSNAKKQVNVAEVTLGLMNQEKEYAIKRRIYRDGTNEYYINGSIVRLKDIQDFFLGTGIGLHSYAIIEQGNIEYFTQMKPHERRIAVEETSGITRFEEKKRDAFARMEEVRANLERVEDLHVEVARNFERAQEEAERLKVYNGLKEKLREIDIALLLDGHIKLEKRALKLRERVQTLAAEMEAKEAERQGVREKVRAKEGEIELIDTVTRQLEVDIKGKEKDMESRLLELNYLEEEKKRLETAAADLRTDIEGLTAKIGQAANQGEELDRSAGLENDRLARLEASGRQLEAQREALKGSREACEREAEERRNELFSVMTQITEIKNRIIERERAAKEREARQARRAEEEARLRERANVLDQQMAGLRVKIDEQRTAKTGIDNEEKQAGEHVAALAHDTAQLRGTIEGLKGVRRGKEEIFRKMKSAVEGRSQENVPYKQLINILKPSKETEQFMERFFSREMEYHVLLEQDPLNLSILAKQYPVNFIFFPKKGMFGLESAEADVKLHTVESLAEAFKKIDEGEEGLFLAGNVLVDSRGFVLRGQDKGAISVREFREKMKLEAELAQIDDELKVTTARFNELQNEQREAERGRQAVLERKKAADNGLAELERRMVGLSTEAKGVGERLAEVSGAPLADDDSPGTASPEQEAAERERLEQQRGAVEAAMGDVKTRLEAAKEEYGRIDKEFHDASIAIERARNQVKANQEEAGRKRSAVEAFRKEQAAKQERLSQTETDAGNIMQKAAEIEKSYAELQEESKASVARYEEMKQKLGDLHMEKTGLAEGVQAIEQEIEKTRQKIEGVEREKLLLEEKRETILTRLRDDYGVEDVAAEAPTGVKDEAERDRILAELAEMGDVNFRAEKERTELAERMEFLEKQKTDLVQAMESLKKTIAKIDSVSHELFLETFERVNQSFKRFTQILFKGGQGMLMFNQETNGIDLYVQPAGKKVVRMELLSGGEKALISLSFLLSLMDTKASPFTLLDEIDAPLDDANLLSLLDIVKEISKKTQILLITHNRMTMESSNTIYGITMEEDGVSKTVSIKL